MADDHIPEAEGDPSLTVWPEGSMRGNGVDPGISAATMPRTRAIANDADQTRDSASPPQGATLTTPGYDFGRLLGEGGMGEVFEAFQGALRRTVALKTIRGDHWGSTAGRDALRAEFVREALIAARLEHPNISPVHDLTYIGPDDRPHLAMKLIRGEAWSRVITRDFKSMPVPDFLAKHLPILERMALAVAFAHSRGIIHRDLKPGQVMVGDFGETVLMDWGLALQFRDHEESAKWPQDPREVPSVASASNPAGTPSMMAPEQTSRTPDGLGPHTDVYLLGGTLYLLLTGTMPHEGASPKAAMLRAAVGVVTPPRTRNPQRAIAEELAELAMSALRPVAAERIASAEAFIQGLRDYMSGATRRRESEVLAREAAELVHSTGELKTEEAYERHAAVADRVGRALELWSDNRAALDTKALNLQQRIHTETAAGDLQMAATHHAELTTLAKGNPSLSAPADALAAELRAATARRARQHRQRAIFAWAATLLLLGHGIGMTLFSYYSRKAAHDLEAQTREIALRGNREVRDLSMQLGDSLLAEGKPREALQHYAKALALAQLLDGTGDAVSQEAARKIGEASKLASELPPPPSE